MKVGAHISIEGGIINAPKNAAKIGCEVFQMFTCSPQGGKVPELTGSIVKKFKEELKKYDLSEFYIHTPYYINLASSKPSVRHGSVSVIRDDMERGAKLGAKYLMTHLGSATDLGQKKAIEKVIKGIRKILDGYKGTTQFLVEMSAGAGQIMGDTFEEISKIIETTYDARFATGVCFDTCHAFVSGYDLRTTISVKKTLDQFDKIIGLEKLKLIHANDSKADLGSHVDRHEHIGYGKIGLGVFRAICRDPRLKNINLIIETPKDGKNINDLKTLKELRNEKY